MEETQPVAWDHYIRPQGLLDLIWNTAPYLEERLPPPREGISPEEAAGGPDGFLHILAAVRRAPEERHEGPEQALLWYFALCLASHHATVATYVPTDVDSKIRGLLWRETRDQETLRAMYRIGEAMHGWTLDGYSTRTVDCGPHGILSGHDGEWLSVLTGAHGRFLALGDAEYAERSGQAIHEELVREARAFSWLCQQPGLEIETLQAAMSVIHNLGDVNQGISFWSGAARQSESARRFERLAQENTTGYGGVFQYPGSLYKDLLASEGHRHYPLRAVKPLRRHPELLLPLGPFLDGYGATLGRTSHVDAEGRTEVLEALVRGCTKVPGQAGYYRALAGFRESSSRAFQAAADAMPTAARKLLRDSEMQRRIAVPRHSFESSYTKRVEQLRRQRGPALAALAESLA